MLEHSLQECLRAEGLCKEMLARTDQYGYGEADTTAWEERLSDLAQVRQRLLAISQRLAEHGS